MSFEEEWAELKSGRGDSTQSPRMQLNGYNTEKQGPGTPNGTYEAGLSVHQDDLGAVGHDAYLLHHKLRKLADIDGKGVDNSGNSTNDRAAQELRRNNFELGGALRKAVSMWNSQCRTLQQGCARISNHLDYTKARHADDDGEIAASLKSKDGSGASTSAIYKWIK